MPLFLKNHSFLNFEILAADHSEFNQCQSQLAQLYKDGRKSKNRSEFAAYSIIYCLYTRNMTDMTKRLSQLTEDMANEQIISDALKLRSHLSLGNYLVSDILGDFIGFGIWIQFWSEILFLKISLLAIINRNYWSSVLEI